MTDDEYEAAENFLRKYRGKNQPAIQLLQRVLLQHEKMQRLMERMVALTLDMKKK